MCSNEGHKEAKPNQHHHIGVLEAFVSFIDKLVVSGSKVNGEWPNKD